jgi:hypothetical protein
MLNAAEGVTTNNATGVTCVSHGRCVGVKHVSHSRCIGVALVSRGRYIGVTFVTQYGEVRLPLTSSGWSRRSVIPTH